MLRRRSAARLCSLALAGALALGAPAVARADTAPPNLVPLLAGYSAIWRSDGGNDLHGTVVDPRVLQRDDRIVVWINRHATAAQRFRALQDSEYEDAADATYDQSITVSTALGSVLGPIYVHGRESGALPLTSAVVDSTDGTTGAFVGTAAAKAAYSHPRPYLPSDPSTAAVAGDAARCAPAAVNGSSQRAIRVGRPWADARGNLLIRRVAPVTDTTHRFSPHDVPLDAGYGAVGICTGGSFPSGHTTTAYQAGIVLATLLPELAPEILARASEAGNDRIVLGVHYPLDVVGGRIDGEAAVAARWSDPAYRTGVLEPARRELVRYLQQRCGHALAVCIAQERAYRSDPYGGRAMPGGTAQVVTGRRSAVAVYTERATYGFAASGRTGRAPSVPAGAEELLRTTFPALSAAERRSVLAQTELPSGYPLDGTGTAAGGWQRLDLARAMSATVLVGRGSVRVIATGGTARIEHRR